MSTTRRQLREEWIAALRSGDYTQAKGMLHNTAKDDRFCCLGVACSLFAERLTMSRQLISGAFPGIAYDGRSGTMPQRLVNALGLIGRVGESGQTSIPGLAEMNDAGKTFQEIADALETGHYWQPDADPNVIVIP